MYSYDRGPHLRCLPAPRLRNIPVVARCLRYTSVVACAQHHDASRIVQVAGALSLMPLLLSLVTHAFPHDSAQDLALSPPDCRSMSATCTALFLTQEPKQCSQWLNVFLPFSRLRFNTFRPFLLRNRARKPCRRFRTMWEGLYVSRFAPLTCSRDCDVGDV